MKTFKELIEELDDWLSNLGEDEQKIQVFKNEICRSYKAEMKIYLNEIESITQCLNIALMEKDKEIEILKNEKII